MFTSTKFTYLSLDIKQTLLLSQVQTTHLKFTLPASLWMILTAFAFYLPIPAVKSKDVHAHLHVASAINLDASHAIFYLER